MFRLTIVKIKISLVLFTLISFLFLPTNAHAAEDIIRVSGYQYGTAWLPLAHPNLTPPLLNYNTTVLYSHLKNLNNFGPSGTVPCTVNIIGQVSAVTAGSLVDTGGNLLVDIFWGGAKFANLTNEEAEELAKFVNAGGVLYVTGGGWQDTNTPGRGPEYNLLFEKLGIEDRFDANYSASGNYVQTSEPLESLITQGLFGNVGSLANDSFRKFNRQSLEGIVFKAGTEESVVHEKRIGKGYLVVTGSFLYTNFLLQTDTDNLRYYLNLFALGCGNALGPKAKVLDVPSFKQGLWQYDDSIPSWEGETYDDGDKQKLFCDINNNGASIAECGCALTSATMIMRYNEVDKLGSGTEITPKTVNDYFKNWSVWTGEYYKSYGFVNGDINWQAVSNLTSDSNVVFSNQPKLDQPKRENYSLDKIKQYIDNGTPVIQQVTGKFGLHWVLIKGYDPDTNRLIINDPVRPDKLGEYSYLDELYSPVAARSMITYVVTQSDFRSYQFVSPSSAHILVTDQNGKKTGYDLLTGSIVEEIPNSQYIFEGFYGDATSIEDIAPSETGMYFLTLQLPQDGKYQLQVIGNDNPDPVSIYSSDQQGNLVSDFFTPQNGTNYEVLYDQQTAGEVINISIDAQIDIVPFVKTNIVIPHKWFSIPVAILTTDSFDVTKVDKASLTFGKTGDEDSFISCSNKLLDVNRDKEKDLICFFSGDKAGLAIEDVQATLKGSYDAGVTFGATDSVRILKPWHLF